MKRLLKPVVEQTAACALYKNIMLDFEFANYYYTALLPVFLHFGSGYKVGEARLFKKDGILYGTLMLKTGKDYEELYPHIPFDSRGCIQAVVLSPYPCADNAIVTLPYVKKQSSNLIPAG